VRREPGQPGGHQRLRERCSKSISACRSRVSTSSDPGSGSRAQDQDTSNSGIFPK